MFLAIYIPYLGILQQLLADSSAYWTLCSGIGIKIVPK